MRVAVMQPYFYPYPGYFRLIAGVDLFILFDCVQFPRRGRVHRAPLPVPAGADPAWLTLPLAAQPRDTLIRDLRLAPDRDARWQAALARLPWLAGAQAGAPAGPVAALLAEPLPEAVAPLLERHLRATCAVLGLTTAFARSSDFALDPALRAQDRVIALARAAGATTYCNLPGGQTLYHPAAFAAAGMALRFTPPYRGPHMSMIHALCTADPAGLRAELLQPAGSGPWGAEPEPMSGPWPGPDPESGA